MDDISNMSRETTPERQNGALTNRDTRQFSAQPDVTPRETAFDSLDRGMNELVHIITCLRSIDHYMEVVDFEDVLDALKRQRPDFVPTERAMMPWTFVAQREVLERVWTSLGFAVDFVHRARDLDELLDWT